MLQRPEFPDSFETLVDQYRNLPPEERQRRRQERAQELREQTAAENRRHWLELCRRMSDIGPRFVERTFENFRLESNNLTLKAAFEAAKEVAADPSLGLYLLSTNPKGDQSSFGVGKSHLAAAIVNDVTLRGVPAVFTTGVALLDRIKESYDRNGNPRDGAGGLMERLARVDVLVLDDLGKERVTAWMGERLYALINRRYEEKRPLIVTANDDLAGLALKWVKNGMDRDVSYALTDRVKEMCRSNFVKIMARSQRGEQ